MGASKSMSKDKSMDASNSRAKHRKNTSSYQGNSGAVAEYLVGNLKVGSSGPTCAQVFFRTPPENSGGTKNSAENLGPYGRIFFATCTN
jgi:hypothetical protein